MFLKRQVFNESLSNWMHRSLAILEFATVLAVAFTATGNRCFAEIEGTTYHVGSEDANVYSGPSDDTYVTTTLSPGSRVEVYHTTREGWSAIRPPAGSFDWIDAKNVHVLPGGKSAEVVHSPAPSWIGTEEEISSEHLKWQVKLQQKQIVSIIGEQSQAIDNDNSKLKTNLWLKIQPPQGEFRWIRQSELLDEAQQRLVQKKRIQNRTSHVVANDVQLAAATEIRTTVQQLPEPQTLVTASMNDSSELRSADMSDVDALVSVPTVPSSRKLPHTSDNIVEASDDVVPSSAIIQSVQNDSAYDGQSILVEPSMDISSGSFPEYDENGNEIIYEGMGDSLEEESFVVDDGACASCSGENNGDHRVDSFRHWNSTEASQKPLPKVRVHPLGKILGIIGLVVSEAEIVPNASCQSCGMPSCNGRCKLLFGHHNRGVQDPSLSRVDRLPRPGQTNRLRSGNGLPNLFPFSHSTSMSNPVSTSTSPPKPLSDSAIAASSTSPLGTTTDWHSTSRASLGRPQAPLNDAQSMNFTSPSTTSLSASDLGEPLTFSTPEIQRTMVELSQTVSQPVQQWTLTPFMARAKQWIETSNDPIARGEARLLMERLENFESIRQRSISMASSVSSSTPTFQLAGFQKSIFSSSDLTPLPTDANSQDPPIVARNSDGTVPSDASGWLVEVFTQRPGHPPFALTDDAGGIIAYVQPSPGMNLKRYIKQPVGIYGLKGYLPDQSARMITAERIVRVR